MYHPPCYLYGSQEEEEVSVSLSSASIEGKLVNDLLFMKFTLTFVNNSPNLIEEIVFEYLMDEHSTVCSFEATLGEQRVVSQIEKKDDDNTVEWSTEHFREEVTNCVKLFSAALGTMTAGETLVVELGILGQLRVQDGEIVFFMPTIFGTEDISFEKFSLTIESSNDIEEVISVNHDIDFARDKIAKKGEVVWTLDPNKSFIDVVLNIQVSSSDKGIAFIEEDPQGSLAISVTCTPPVKIFSEIILAEIFFLIDCSGSMDNGRLDVVKESVQSILQNLPPNTLFNVVCFGATNYSLFPASKKVNSETISTVKLHFSDLFGILGSTNVLGALKFVFQQAIPTGYTRQIFVFTDGEVKNPKEILPEVDKNSHHTRISVFGLVGPEPNLHFSRGIPQRSGGVLVLEGDSKQFKNKVTENVRSLLKPSLTNIRAEWHTENGNSTFGSSNFESDNSDTLFSPFEPIVIYRGGDICLSALTRKEAGIPKHVTITASVPGNTNWTVQVPLPEPVTVDAPFVHRHVARALLKDIAHCRSSYHKNGILREGFSEEVLKSKILQISKKYNIPSTVTCLQAYEIEEDQEVDGTVMDTIEHVSTDECFIYERESRDDATANDSGGSGNSSAGSFWSSFGFNNDSELDKLLESGEYTLEQLLAEEEMLGECQAYNDSLLTFIKKPHVCKGLFAHAIKQPAPDDKLQQQYTNVSAEILSLPIWTEAIDVIFSQPCLSILTSIFSTSSPLSPSLLSSLSSLSSSVSPLVSPSLSLSSSTTTTSNPQQPLSEGTIYRVCHIMGSLMNLHREKMIEYLISQQDLVENFVCHLYSPHIIDFLANMIKSDNANVLQWLFRGNIIREGIKFLGPGNSSAAKENATNLLLQLLPACKALPPNVANPFNSEDTFRQIFSVAFEENMRPSSSFLNSIQILITFVRTQYALQQQQQPRPNLLQRQIYLQQPPPQLPSPLPRKHPLFIFFCGNISGFKNIFLNNSRTRDGANGTPINICGQELLSLVEFLEVLIRTKSPLVIRAIIDADILSDCLRVFLHYSLNNFLHAAVFRLVEAVLMTENEDNIINDDDTIKEATNEDLKMVLFTKADILGRIVYGMEIATKEGKSGNCGFGGHLMQMVYVVLRFKMIPKFTQFFEKHPSWHTFEIGILAEIQSKSIPSDMWMRRRGATGTSWM